MLQSEMPVTYNPPDSLTQQLRHQPVLALLQVLPSSFRDDLPFVEHRQPIGNLLDTPHVVCDHNRCRLALFLNRYDELPNLVRRNRIEPGRRFVKEQQGWLRAKTGTTETGREAKFYALTPAGKKQLARELESWDRLSGAIGLVVRDGEA